MSEERLHPRTSYPFDAERLEQLKTIFPEAFADGKVRWGVLREALGDHLEDEELGAEHFGLSWPGKRDARRRASQPSKGTLVPVPGAGVNEDTTRNIFIEADNLEALKLLQKSYAGRVKMIYIDPPYNTGNDFVYRDDFAEKHEDYLQRTGQVDEKLNPLTTNTKTDGRFHSNWLSMMQPRLLLARNLLEEQGAIFVSIDNNELGNLRILMNELYGEENFVDCLIWQKRVSPANDANFFSSDHEYILIYAKNKSEWRPNRLERTEEQLTYYSNPDNDPRGDWNSATYTTNRTQAERPNLYYPIVNPNTGEEVYPGNGKTWKYSREKHLELQQDNRVYWGAEGRSSVPRLKLFLTEAPKVVPRSVLLYSNVGHTQEATTEFAGLFPEGGFSYPKPVRLIKHLLTLATDNNSQDIVLDFFAGSGTTAQAVMELNREDNGNRQFILTQVAEETALDSDAKRGGYDVISQITQERIHRAIKKILADQDGKLAEDSKTDLGFKVFRHTISNFKPWEDYTGDSITQVQQRFGAFEVPLVDGWREDDLLVEVMLLQGFPLDSRIESLSGFSANTVRQITSDFHAHSLTICLDAKIADATLNELTLASDDVFVCLDSALTDESKFRLRDRCTLRVI